MLSVEGDKTMDEEINDFWSVWREHKWKVIGIIVFLIVVISIVGFTTNMICQPARLVTKTFDADNILHNYEWFHQTAQDIGASKIKIKNADVMVQKAKSEEAREKWGTVLLGLNNYIQDLIAQYNAKSRMINRNLFKSKELPWQFKYDAMTYKIKEIQ